MPAIDATPIHPEHTRLAQALVAETKSAGGLAPLDLDRFWADQDVARKDSFSPSLPQVAMGNLFSSECVFDELGIPADWYRYYHDPVWMAGLNKQYNDIAEKIVGRRVLNESLPNPDQTYPKPLALSDLFEAKNVFQHESFWLMQAAETPDELSALLDRVEQRLANLRSFLLPPGWDEAKARLLPLGIRPPRYQHQRGPVTFATSIYGIENLLFLIMDQPDLAARLRDTILKSMLAIRRLLDSEAGYTPENAPHGFSFADDNCYLLTPEMYDFFAYPILEGMFARFAPQVGDWRYQHSDSAMGHHLPSLSRLNFSAVNFGPTVQAQEIRAYMPKTEIQGQLAPFTLCENNEVRIVEEFLRDHAATKESRGLVFFTAGSVNNGTKLTSLRLIMAAIQRYGRF